MGRPRLPDNVARLRGIPRPPRRNIDPLPDIPKMPANLSSGARKVWRRTAPELFKLGRLALIDGPTLALYCQWCDQVAALEKELAESSVLIEGQKGNQVLNPLFRAHTTATGMVVKLAKELGCTPLARLTAASIPIEQEEMDELESILTAPTR